MINIEKINAERGFDLYKAIPVGVVVRGQLHEDDFIYEAVYKVGNIYLVNFRHNEEEPRNGWGKITEEEFEEFIEQDDVLTPNSGDHKMFELACVRYQFFRYGSSLDDMFDHNYNLLPKPFVNYSTEKLPGEIDEERLQTGVIISEKHGRFEGEDEIHFIHRALVLLSCGTFLIYKADILIDTSFEDHKFYCERGWDVPCSQYEVNDLLIHSPLGV